MIACMAVVSGPAGPVLAGPDSFQNCACTKYYDNRKTTIIAVNAYVLLAWNQANLVTRLTAIIWQSMWTWSLTTPPGGQASNSMHVALFLVPCGVKAHLKQECFLTAKLQMVKKFTALHGIIISYFTASFVWPDHSKTVWA